ncbi:PREDICTED: aminoacyl tRNA synthase complex-interacting multifunctional protein 1 [Papilio xuthus]|uniref:Aminoacyl tRNA synthase complex-interacting multifunctional protein 1 n=1 Tax=Papilio xuthus TaxID=66420 RepID=A0AAJ6ZII9_PAPXU|nr:PREDICTED: aminoacyl tRNA synthase complex-interacting multifunctional protein 1 [Papilio xuthus]
MICAGRNSLKNMLVKISSNILANAETAEKRLAELRRKVEEIKKFKVEEKIQELIKENSVLSEKIVQAKNELIKLEISHGKKQYSVPSKQVTKSNVDSISVEKPQDKSTEVENTQPTAAKKEKNSVKKIKEKVNPTPTTDNVVDVRKLDFRIGKIVEINKHPDADALYVEKIDCGEGRPRTVVSGLVNHVPIDEMRDKLVIVLCNLKPVKMRGVTSEAMVMCASSPEKVEVLNPPSDAVPGDLVECEGYPREPEAQLNPKKKIFETCAPDLKTNDDKVACYKDKPLIVVGKGAVVAPTLKQVNVK